MSNWIVILGFVINVFCTVIITTKGYKKTLIWQSNMMLLLTTGTGLMLIGGLK